MLRFSRYVMLDENDKCDKSDWDIEEEKRAGAVLL